MTNKNKEIAKKGPKKGVKDPEKPYSGKPTPGRPGWNVVQNGFNKGIRGV
jgi:hypothetical protein